MDYRGFQGSARLLMAIIRTILIGDLLRVSPMTSFLHMSLEPGLTKSAE